jgi:hypothetical protein
MLVDQESLWLQRVSSPCLGRIRHERLLWIALANNLTLVTHNTREFERAKGLQIEDWEVEA